MISKVVCCTGIINRLYVGKCLVKVNSTKWSFDKTPNFNSESILTKSTVISQMIHWKAWINFHYSMSLSNLMVILESSRKWLTLSVGLTLTSRRILCTISVTKVTVPRTFSKLLEHIYSVQMTRSPQTGPALIQLCN